MLLTYNVTSFTSETSKGGNNTYFQKKYGILLETIRRDTLDAFWSRDPGTVKGNLTMAKILGLVVGDEL